jgi:polysaccharide export outer membrane protein
MNQVKSPGLLFCSSNSKLLYVTMIIAIAVFFSSCLGTRNSTYFKTLPSDTTIQSLVNSNFESVIQPNDLLGIVVSSLNSELDGKFNELGIVKSNTYNDITQKGGFLVSKDGTILLHFLGNVKVEGFTRNQLKEKLQKDLLPYMKEPIVTVQYLNKKITVIGEVEKPQVLQMEEEQMPLLEALVNVGDVKQTGDKRNVTIIRENGNQKRIKQVNLEDHSFFQSSWYYLQPNDIVLVNVDKRKYLTEEKRRNVQTTVSLITSIVSLGIILITNVFKL